MADAVLVEADTNAGMPQPVLGSASASTVRFLAARIPSASPNGVSD